MKGNPYMHGNVTFLKQSQTPGPKIVTVLFTTYICSPLQLHAESLQRFANMGRT